MTKESHTIKEIYKDYKEDIKKFEEMLDELKRGEIFESDFKKFRLINGIYGQRQKNFHMVRIKIPAGVLTPLQIREIADIGDEFSNGIAHITTRQDIQYHWVNLENVPTIIERINKIGLTTKDACGDSLRNITVSYLSGICPYEPFEVQKFAIEIAKQFLGKFEDLPRKFKIGFACCEKHSYLIPFNDIGLIPTIKDNIAGFKVYIGGGLGDKPKYAYKYADFLPANKIPSLITAVLTVFNTYGDRKNKRRNRMKFLIENLGVEKFFELVNKEFENLKREENFDIELNKNFFEPSNKIENLFSEDESYNFWLETNLIPQKQEGLYTVLIFLKLGNITTGKLRDIAYIAEKFELNIKTTQDQNIALLNVKEDDIKDIYKYLKSYSLDTVGVSSYLDITSCPGTETCGLGITSSRDISRAIYEKLPKDKTTFEKLKNISIKVSGCPNACAHHTVASIGLHGVAMKIEDRLIPAYVIHLGGNGNLNNAKIGEKIIKIPAKNAVDAVLHLLNLYLEKSNGESFTEFVEKRGIEFFEKELSRFKILYKDVEYNKDWGSDKEFSLEDIGVGECAGIVADKVENSLKEGERLLKQAETHVNKGFSEDAIPHIEKALEIISSGLLVPFGLKVEGKTAIDKFIEQIIGRKLIDEKYINLLTGEIKNINELLKESNRFYNDCKKLYFKLRKETEQKQKKEEKARKEFLDLRGVECPFNFVQAKMKIKEMDTGSILVITLDDEESIRSVPQSLRDEGHEIIDIQEDNGVYTVVVRKR